MSISRRQVLTGALLAGAATSVRAENWPGFRGPLGTGESSEKQVPLRWSATENVRWKAPLPTPSMSSPAVWGQRIFLTQPLDRGGRDRAVLCLDRKNGKELWRGVTVYSGTESTYSGESHYCSGTPATDGERVVAVLGSAGAVCYDMAGKELWGRDFGRAEQIWGTAISPVIWKDLVFINFGPGENTFLAALDKKTGKDVWRIDNPGKYGTDPKDWIGSWSTPLPARYNGRDELIISWPQAVRSVDPRTGKELWRCGGLGNLVYTSPLLSPEVIVAMGGFQGPAIGIKPGGSGDVTATHQLWRVERNPQRIGSGVIVGAHVYILNAIGTAQCIELKTGKTLWEERAGKESWSSMVHAAGRLYVTDQSGTTIVLAAKPQFEVLARNPLDDRNQATPAISNGEIFLRTYQHLWCISDKPG